MIYFYKTKFCFKNQVYIIKFWIQGIELWKNAKRSKICPKRCHKFYHTWDYFTKGSLPCTPVMHALFAPFSVRKERKPSNPCMRCCSSHGLMKWLDSALRWRWKRMRAWIWGCFPAMPSPSKRRIAGVEQGISCDRRDPSSHENQQSMHNLCHILKILHAPRLI